MTTEFVAYVTLAIAIMALAVGIGTYRHSRTNRRVIMKILQRRPEEARKILFQETGELPERFLPPG
ncbi:MAG: hypothetical protein KBD27_02370 [Candidatus Moranbacteria bacterium]|nr:hypothetical protein [Candidatus Moranbacteria bacterium]